MLMPYYSEVPNSKKKEGFNKHMGAGETEMKKWGYISASAGITLALFSLILAILTIVIIQGSVDLTTRNNTLYFAIVLLILAVTAAVLCIVGILKIYKADRIYVTVSARVGQGKQALSQAQTTPVQPVRNQTTTEPAAINSAVTTLI